MASFSQTTPEEEGRPPEPSSYWHSKNLLIHDVNKNEQKTQQIVPYNNNRSLKHTLPKLLCLKKERKSYPNNLNITNNFYKRTRNQNVEEALSSLLWQPYEYQNNKQDKSSGTTPTVRSLSSSSCSCSSISSCDLDEPPAINNGPLTDLHLPNEMVNNLPGLEDQSFSWATSHDTTTTASTSLLLSASRLCTSPIGSVAPESCCGARDVKSSDMQVSNNHCLQNAAVTNVLNINQTNAAENGLNTTTSTSSTANSTANLSHHTNFIAAANVVGLPYHHHRYSSVPSTTTTTTPAGSTNNSNGGSNGNQFRYQQQLPLQQQQQGFVAHLRSASVPKSMHVVPQQISRSTNRQPGVVDLSSNGNLVNVSCGVNTTLVEQRNLLPSVHNHNLRDGTVTVSQTPRNNFNNIPIVNNHLVPQSQRINNNNNNVFRGNTVDSTNTVTVTRSQPSNHRLLQNHFNIPTNTSVVQRNDTGTVSNTHVVPTGNSTVTVGVTRVPATTAEEISTTINNHNVVPTSVASNISNVNVNFYRAVPVNVVSSVPTIQCLPPSNTEHVSNVQIMPLGGTTDVTTEVTVHNPVIKPRVPARTFTNSEAQTDEIPVSIEVPPANNNNRELRRRERRERRHQRRLNNVNHQHQVNDRLPDILNSHLPPPYSPPVPTIVATPPQPPPPQMLAPPPPHSAVLQTVVPNSVVAGSGFAVVAAGQVPLMQGGSPVAVPVPVPPPSGFRFPFPAAGFRRGRFSEEPPKSCCGLLSWKPGSLRWFIAVIALVAVCCVLVGTALGAMRPAGRDHLTVSLLMIGVGIVLVTVSGVAWRLTSHDSSTCRSMLGLGSTESVDVCTRRFVPRLPPSYGRPHHPYAAMMYPEFQFRPPPPSYQASMQEYRLRLLLLERGNNPQQQGVQNAISPPPTYRSHAGSLLRAPLSSRRDAALSEYSCPPSYRSQNSSQRPPPSVLHSREQSLSLSDSNQGGGESMVNVVSILANADEDIALDNITLDSLKMEPESDPLRLLLKGSQSDLEGSKDGNLVTIVQTSDQSPVIVTVSGGGSSNCLDGNGAVQITEIPSEMEILAHL